MMCLTPENRTANLNNIAVKGFALALQLVIVEAVPSLTEVVQETCSSSEDDSEDEVEDISVNSKRKTLSPAHARNIDRQSDVTAGENGNESIAISAHSHNQERPVDLNQLVDVHNKVHGPFLEMPSFSLGLTQEGPLERNHAVVTHDCVVHVPAFTDNVIEKMERPQLFRKSKRQKCFPPALVEDYECGPRVSSRARKNQNCIFSCGDINEIERKYGRLRNKINRDFFIKVDGISVCGKYLVVIPERTRLLRGKVVDILIRLVQYIIHQQFRGERHERYVFLDSKYVSAIGRTYPKFCKSKKKDSYVFPKGLLEMFTRTIDANIQPSRYYFPLNVGKKHWVGICVDRLCGKITVLDCNTSIFSDAIIEKHLQPHLLMLPYLLRLSMQAFGSAEPEPFAVDRSKDISESKNPSDDGFMAVLFMATHVVYGIEACKNINTEVLVLEGKSAAVMASEFKDIV
ncbi:hypothetical protein Bca101_075099 [Brassica carinata]